MTDLFRLDLKVRDYECDMQGIVNNAVYQNYLEHARHEFLLSRGVDFAEQTRQGLNLVVIRAELDYKASLVSGDAFYVTLAMSMIDRIRFQFQQNIYRSDDQLCVAALITGTGVTAAGRPKMPKELINQLITQPA